MWWLILTSDWLLEPAIYKMSNLKSMSVYVSLIILTAVATERAFVSMMLLLRLCLDFTLHLTPSSLQWFWLPLRDLSSSENCRSLTWGSSQEYPWQCSCPGRLPLAGGLHHNSYSRALTAVDVVVTGCRCGPPVPGHCPVPSELRTVGIWYWHWSHLPLVSSALPCDSHALLMASDAHVWCKYARVITPHDNGEWGLRGQCEGN